MELGTYSLSLAVKHIAYSKEFYEKLGFTMIPNAGSVAEKWLIMKNGNVKIGLFEGMFHSNIITFNPKDARSLYKDLKKKHVKMVSVSASIEDEKGPCNFMISDPDGNQMLFDQYND